MLLEREYDVLIVGARVAGATLAALLGDAGLRVLAVDRAAFPSSTLSTHYFTGERGLAVLDRLGLLPAVRQLGCPPLPYKYLFFDGEADWTRVPAHRPGRIGYALSARRAPLDSLLVQRARQAGRVTVLEQTGLLGLVYDGGRVVGARLATPAGEQTVYAGLVVGADGRHSAVARALDAPYEAFEPGRRGIYYVYLRDFGSPAIDSLDGAEFSLNGDEMAYVFPSDDGVTCVALSVSLSVFRWLRQRPHERFCQRLAAHRGLATRFSTAIWEGRLLGCGPERSYVRVPAGPGWALVGDAGMHQDPWSGQGMDKAMVHATFLAEAATAWLAGRCSEQEASTAFHERRNADGLPGYQRTVAMARDLSQLAQEWRAVTPV
jgi:flavin-dependent dehydrogenase